MNLNFDVQGALFPNPLTMVVQLLSTAIIFWAVKKWLWLPIRNIMSKRQDALQASLDSANAQNVEASKNLEEAKNELKKARQDSLDIVASAKNEADNLKKEMLAKAKDEAQAKIDEAEVKIENRKKEVQDELHDEIVSVAMAAVEKLLEEKATSKDDEKAVSEFVKEVRG